VSTIFCCCATWQKIFILPTEGMQSIAIRVYMNLCMSVPLASQKPHVQPSWSFLYMLLVDMAHSYSDNSGICFVLPVLCMTSCFNIMGQKQRLWYVSSSSPSGSNSWWLCCKASKHTAWRSGSVVGLDQRS